AARRPDSLSRRAGIAAVARKVGKPVCITFVGGWIGGPGTFEAEADPNFAWVYEINRCVAAIKAWHWRSEKYDEFASNGGRKLVHVSPADAKDKAASLIKAAKNKALTERESKEVLACYGVPVTGEKLVQSAD